MLAVRAPTLGSDDQASLFRDALDRLHTLGLRTPCVLGDDRARGLVDTPRPDRPGGPHHRVPRPQRPRRQPVVADLRAHATEAVDAHPDAAAWRAEGAAMTRDEIVACCLEHLDAD